MPRAFTRLIWEAAKVRDRRPNDIERELKLERLDGGIEIGQEERARNRVLKGGATCVSAFISGKKLATADGFVRGEDVLGFPSRVDFALLNFVHGLDVTLKFGGERSVRRRDVCHDQIFDSVGGEFGRERDSHGDFATPVAVCERRTLEG